MARQSATEVKIDFLVKEIKELRSETKCLRADINKGKGAIWGCFSWFLQHGWLIERQI